MTKNVLLAVLCTVASGIVKAQTVPTVCHDVTADSGVPTVTSSKAHFYEQIPLVGEVIGFARKHLSVRYRSGGTTTQGFDCSDSRGFCFRQFGIFLPHSSAAQGSVGEAIDKDAAQPGDLILFKGHSAGGSRIGHVGLITEVIGDRVKFIHSAWNGGVRYDYLHADYYQRRFVGIRRVAHLLASN